MLALDIPGIAKTMHMTLCGSLKMFIWLGTQADTTERMITNLGYSSQIKALLLIISMQGFDLS